MFLRLGQLLLVIIVLGALVLAYNIVGRIQIDTNLADLTPNNASLKGTDNKTKIDSAAKLELSRDIQNRLLLLISGSDEDIVVDASEELRDSLLSLGNSRDSWLKTIEFQVIDDTETTALNLIQSLKPYRFKLLTAQQRKSLENDTNSEIIAQAKHRLYDLSSNNRLYSFKDDPLAWHSDFLIQLFETMEPQKNSASNDAQSVISLTANQSLMNLQEQEQLLLALDSAIKKTTDNYDVSIDRSGMFFFAVDAASKSKQDISRISMGSSIGVILLLLIAFRSIKSFILPIVSIALGVGVAFLALHAIYGKVHVLTIVFGASLIGIVVDYSLHYFYHQAANKQSKNGSAVLHRALLLSLLTSLIGYSALGFSSLQALQKVALFSCLGLLVAWLSVISIGGILARKPLTLDDYFLPAIEQFCSRIIARFSIKIWLSIALVVISTALLASLKLPTFSDDPRLFYSASKEILASERAVAEVANDFEPGRYLSVSGNDIEQVFSRTQALLAATDAHPNLQRNNLVSIVNWLPSPTLQADDYAALGKLYVDTRDGALSQFFKEISQPDNLTSLRKQYSNARDTILYPTEIMAMLKQSAPPMWFQSKSRITNFVLIRKGVDHRALQEVAQTDGVVYVNTLADTTLSLKQQRMDASKLLLLAYLLIIGLVLLRYRSFSAASMLLVPLTSSAAVVLICLILGVSLNLFHVMALFLVLGFGMDYTIFIREFGDDSVITLQAILLSAMTSLLSFGLLAISSIPIAQAFGSTLLIGNCFNLVGVFVYSFLHSTSVKISNQPKGYDYAK